MLFANIDVAAEAVERDVAVAVAQLEVQTGAGAVGRRADLTEGTVDVAAEAGRVHIGLLRRLVQTEMNVAAHGMQFGGHVAGHDPGEYDIPGDGFHGYVA